MKNIISKNYERPTITVVKMKTEGCLLDFSTQVPVINKPADRTDVLSKRNFEFDLWATDDEELQDDEN